LGRVIEEGSLVIAEDREKGILIRPAVAVLLERRAEFLLWNAVDREDYACAEEEVRKMGSTPPSSRTAVSKTARDPVHLVFLDANIFGRQYPLLCGLPAWRGLEKALEAIGG